jgi:hypothetical protein
MLIRNITSKQDLENKKKQQAEILKMSIDNVALQQQRVQDFQNPNKPPPIPPQYKTSSEIEQDVMEQQKMAIDNLKSLNISFQVAAGVSQALLQQPEGIGNLVKLNKYFPAIRDTFSKRFSSQALNDVNFIMENLDIAFEEIDNNLGFFKSGVAATSLAYEPQIVQKLILSSENCKKLVDIVFSIKLLDTPISGAKLQSIEDTLESLKDVSPSEKDIKAVDTLEQSERNKIAKSARIIDGKSLTVARANLIIETLGPIKTELSILVGGDFNAVTPQVTQTLYTDMGITEAVLAKTADLLNKGLSKVTPKLLADIDKLKNQIVGDLTNMARATASVLGAPISASQKQLSINQNKITEAVNYLESKLSGLGHTQVTERMTSRTTNPADNTQSKTFQDNQGNASTVEIYDNKFINRVPTTDGRNPAADGSNVIYEILKKVDGRKSTTESVFIDKAGNQVQPFDVEAYLYQARIKQDVRTGATEWYASNTKSNLRYNLDDLKSMAINIESAYLDDRIVKEDNFDYVKNKQDATFAKQGFGFNAKRIKVGKGIGKEVEQPRYREFGKYIIHMPHLIDENVLNLKFPSAGSIPSIKPVKIDDNYKQFIMDVLDTNKVNKRHHETLTSEEKNHFAKIARGAKITNTLNFNPEEEDDEDYKRFELLIGEINAGNDNPKMIAEVKRLLKKYVENGRISKLKATDILLEL